MAINPANHAPFDGRLMALPCRRDGRNARRLRRRFGRVADILRRAQSTAIEMIRSALTKTACVPALIPATTLVTSPTRSMVAFVR